MNTIDMKALYKAIDAKHHSMERFYDIDEAEKDRLLNIEMAERIESGNALENDVKIALELIDQYGV